jgi:hypothetical protein
MAEENRTVSIQMPSQLLKEVADVVDKAKPDAQSSTTVTMSFSADAVKSLLTLREDMTAFQERQVVDSHTAVDRFIKTSELRTSFYEKLILLAGGSFALSLTFLGSLHRTAVQGHPLAAMGRLETAWVLLLACIVFSWFHNLNRYSAVDHATIANATFVNSMHHTWLYNLLSRAASLFKASESPVVGFSDGVTFAAKMSQLLSKQSQDAGKQSEHDLKLHYRASAILGSLALLSIVIAFGLMIAFAIKNAALL